MFTSTDFTYDSISGDYFGLKIASIDDSITTQHPFGVSRVLNTEKIPGKPTSYFYHLEYEPLVFTISFVKMKDWTQEDKINIVRWLFQEEYKPFISDDNTGIIYNCMAIDGPEKILIGNEQRLITITFQCDAPWAWSEFFVNVHNLSSNPSGGTIIQMQNLSNIMQWYEPELEITKVGAGNVILTNLQDSSRITSLNNLLNNEVVYINNAIKQISSNQSGRVPLNHFNRKWLRLAYGINSINVQGNCIIKTRMRYPIGI